MAAGAALPIQSSVAYQEDFHRVYTSIYHVITDDRTDGPIVAIEAVGIPAYRSPYVWYTTGDPWAFCNGITANLIDEDATSRKWQVTVTHSTAPAFRCGDQRIENPLDEPPKLSGSFARFSKPCEYDSEGEKITNSVDEPFVPAIEKDDSRDTLIVDVNTETLDLVMRATYRDAINDGPLWGLPAYTVKLGQWSWQIAYHGTCTPYVINRVEFEISYKEDHETFGGVPVGNIIGWREEILDAGFRHKVDCVTTPKEHRYLTNTDAHDNQIHQPMALDGDGNIISIECGDEPFYHIFKIYRELDFTPLLQFLRLTDPLQGPFA